MADNYGPIIVDREADEKELPRAPAIKPGTHVSAADDVVGNLSKMVAMFEGATTAQIFTHGPRNTHAIIGHGKFAALKEYIDESKLHLYVHSTYVTNPWTRGARQQFIWNHTKDQLETAAAIGARGLVVHLPLATPETIVAGLLPHMPEIIRCAPTRFILEMKAVKSNLTKSYETWEKIHRLIELLRANGITSDNVQICIDTAHIYAGKAAIRTAEEARAWLADVDPSWIALIHLNGNEYDAQKRAGDKHAVPHSGDDKIWSGVEWEDSGCRVFVEWCQQHRVDFVLEIKDKHLPSDVVPFMALVNKKHDTNA